MANADVAVVVGSYESAQFLGGLLDSVEQQTHPPAETVVADAGSRDDSTTIARERGAAVLELPNRGLGFLYNRGAEATTARYVFVCNPDVVLEPDCLAALAAALDERPTAFAADPVQLSWDGARTIHARTLLRRGSLRDPMPGLRLDPLVGADGVVPTVTANAGGMLLRRDRLLELGGFDERYFLEYEDLDLCWRGWLRGWESVHVPSARMRHWVGGATPEEDRAQRLAASHRSIVRFAVKCLPPREVGRALLGELARAPRHPREIAGALAAVPDALRARRRLQGGRGDAFRRLSSLGAR